MRGRSRSSTRWRRSRPAPRPGNPSRFPLPGPRRPASRSGDRWKARRCTAARWSGRCRSATDGCGTPARPRRAGRDGGARPWRAPCAPPGPSRQDLFRTGSRRTSPPPRQPSGRAARRNPDFGFPGKTSPAALPLARAFVPLDEGVGAVVVDRLEVLRLDRVRLDALVEVEHRGDVAHHVLDELRVVVGALGDELLVGPLEQAVELARALLFDDVDDLLDPDEVVGARGDGDVRALVVRAALGDLLRAGAEAG